MSSPDNPLSHRSGSGRSSAQVAELQIDHSDKKTRAWELSLEPAGRHWAGLEWQKMGREQRRNEWRRHLAELDISMDSFRNQQIADVGCGPVGIVYFLDAVRSVGVDPHADQCEQWNGYWGRRVELIHSTGEKIPQGSSSFDAVFCTNVLDHTCNPEAVIRELARILKPGGLLVLHTDLDSPIRKLHKKVKKICAILHPHSLTYDWLMNTLSREFRVLRVHRDPAVFQPVWRQMKYEAYWDGVMYRLTGSKSFVNHVWLKASKQTS